MTDLTRIGAAAKEAAFALANASTAQKNAALMAIAAALEAHAEDILRANREDVEAARANGMSPSMLDRLSLSEARVKGMAEGVREVAALADPVGRVLSGSTLACGLEMEKITVPLGVIGIIFEARPNVTSDAAALCLKSGNACILRGGKEAIRSNTAIASVMRGALKEAGLDENCVCLIEDTDRATATAMMRLNRYIDCLIPRGGAGLIRSVVENATVPVIETGVGNCHAYVEKTADIAMAAEIVFNAKTSRPSVCNALETLLVDEAIAETALPVIAARLKEKNVELRGCPRTCAILPEAVPACENDYEDRISRLHPRGEGRLRHGRGHCPYPPLFQPPQRVHRHPRSGRGAEFTREVDSAAVYVNASTRFTDGGVFGLGAEIGISTQKLHARGPMGLEALVSYKYVLYGDGQVR